MTVTVENVRFQLAGVENQRIPDETVQQQLDIALSQVSRATGVEDETIDNAVLLVAVVYTSLQYIEVVRREIGNEPVNAFRLVEHFKEMSDIELRSLGVPDFWRRRQQVALPPVSMTESAIARKDGSTI
jgi:hypothetical protein